MNPKLLVGGSHGRLDVSAANADARRQIDLKIWTLTQFPVIDVAEIKRLQEARKEFPV